MLDPQWVEKYWSEQAQVDEADPDRLGFITGDGHHFRVGSAGRVWTRGFGGLRWLVTFDDGRRIETTNLWTQGLVPLEFRERFSVRASVEELDYAPLE
jgi:hypothetical protein